ncbi:MULTISPECIES: resolvase [Aphanothece]|uniref:resolvase n=1 Tax=Aphanothece TaxID=1121 RepID=UPI003984C889
MSEPAVPPQASRLAGLDPGRSKCGLVLADAGLGTILAAAILPPAESLALLRQWQQQAGLVTVVLGNGTGSRSWPPQLARLGLQSETVEEAGTTLAARRRYWQLAGSGGWRRLLPEGLRLPPRDIDDVVAQLLVERHLGQPLSRRGPGVLRELADQAHLSARENAT